MKDKWNICDNCGVEISIDEFNNGSASRRMITPDSDYSFEDYETLCGKCLLEIDNEEN